MKSNPEEKPVSIYERINQFLLTEARSAQELMDFANEALKLHPSERRFLQEWFLEMIVSPRFGGALFGNIRLQHCKAFWIKES